MGVSLRDEVIGKLKELPAKKQEAEKEFYEALHDYKRSKQDLEIKEAKLSEEGKVTGKNELERRGKLIKHTENLQRDLMNKEIKVDLAKINLHRLNSDHESYLMIAKLISNQEEPFGSIKFKVK